MRVAVAILEQLLARREGLYFTELHRLLGVPKETLNRRLKLLVAAGVLGKERRGRETVYYVVDAARARRLIELYRDLRGILPTEPRIA